MKGSCFYGTSHIHYHKIYVGDGMKQCVKWKHKKAVFVGMLLFYVGACMLGACKKQEDVRYEIDFTVCDETKIPDELMEIIEGKKQQPFQLSFENNSYMYIVVGYGGHDQRNLNVVVEDFYRTDKAIYLDTNLYSTGMTPTDAMVAGDASMYPYIVLKCEKYNLPIYYNAP